VRCRKYAFPTLFDSVKRRCRAKKMSCKICARGHEFHLESENDDLAFVREMRDKCPS
jgi:hypothetical protein